MLFKGYGAKVGLGNMRVKAENRMVTYDFAMLYSLREGQTNCDVKESVYNVATAKILVELELKPEDLARLNLKKKLSEVLK